MNPKIVKEEDILKDEFPTPEKCYILENWNKTESPNVSVARARLEKGLTTKPHYLKGVDEIYLILEGKGRVKVGILLLNVLRLLLQGAGLISTCMKGTGMRVLTTSVFQRISTLS